MEETFDIQHHEWEAAPIAIRLLLKKLIEENGHLKSRIIDLEARLSKNSENSHKPPSSDGPAKPNRTQSERTPSGKKAGGQPGHPGHALMRSKKPDYRIRHRVETCGGCGSNLSEQKAGSIQERQVFDLPPIHLVCTAHELETKTCPNCGTHNEAIAPGLLATESGSVIYGPELRSLCVYLIQGQLLPYGRTSDLIHDLCGQRLSVGTLSVWVQKAYTSLASTEQLIAEALIKDHGSVHFDETGIRSDSTNHWLHSASNLQWTHFSFHLKRGIKAMEDIGILPRFRGTAIHDRWESYFGYDACRHGLCGAHLLRDLRFVWEHEEEPWAKEMHGLLVEMNRVVTHMKANNQTLLSVEKVAHWQKKYRRLLQEGFRYHSKITSNQKNQKHHSLLTLVLKRGRKKQRPGKNLLDALDKHQESILLFLKDFSVPFTNNQGERDIRMTKVKLKISGCFRSVEGAKHFCRIRGYLSTARKQGWSLLGAMKSVFLGKPLQPIFGVERVAE